MFLTIGFSQLHLSAVIQANERPLTGLDYGSGWNTHTHLCSWEARLLNEGRFRHMNPSANRHSGGRRVWVCMPIRFWLRHQDVSVNPVGKSICLSLLLLHYLFLNGLMYTLRPKRFNVHTQAFFLSICIYIVKALLWTVQLSSLCLSFSLPLSVYLFLSPSLSSHFSPQLVQGRWQGFGLWICSRFPPTGEFFMATVATCLL